MSSVAPAAEVICLHCKRAPAEHRDFGHSFVPVTRAELAEEEACNCDDSLALRRRVAALETGIRELLDATPLTACSSRLVRERLLELLNA